MLWSPPRLITLQLRVRIRIIFEHRILINFLVCLHWRLRKKSADKRKSGGSSGGCSSSINLVSVAFLDYESLGKVLTVFCQMGTFTDSFRSSNRFIIHHYRLTDKKFWNSLFENCTTGMGSGQSAFPLLRSAESRFEQGMMISIAAGETEHSLE